MTKKPHRPPHMDGSIVFDLCQRAPPHLLLAHPSPHLKRHLDRFNSFRTAHGTASPLKIAHSHGRSGSGSFGDGANDCRAVLAECRTGCGIVLSDRTLKAKLHYTILVADRSEAGRRPAVSWNLAHHLAR